MSVGVPVAPAHIVTIFISHKMIHNNVISRRMPYICCKRLPLPCLRRPKIEKKWQILANLKQYINDQFSNHW